MNICTVIIAGGSGTRMFPLSRTNHPKQFFSLYNIDGETMFQSTCNRFKDINVDSLITICNDDHRFLVADQLKEINIKSSIILEPIGKNTAPAIALAAFNAEEDDILVVLPSDHHIGNIKEFNSTIEDAAILAEDNYIVTLGIKPNKPHTGYGYIKTGKILKNGFIANSFVEKPDIDQAKKYLDDGNYLWNSGIFIFKASKYLHELKKFRPEIYKVCELANKESKIDNDFIRIDKDIFNKCSSESIDYAIMENAKDIAVLPLDAEWSDLGSWNSLWDISIKDIDNNVIQGDVVVRDTSNSFIRSENKLITTIGIENIIIVDTKDALLVADKNRSEEVKHLVESLKEQSRNEPEIHREVLRPWGKYDSVDSGKTFQVKRITVNPGAKLSLQKHKYRSEHWVVVSGIARVTLDNKIFMLSPNESTYIPIGAIHSLENVEEIPLELIEVQSGSYLGEDDIERFEDVYGRLE
jgi:mannose-1-phosphate guanylyltransferase/mannose-6-phosphate isomerase